ncbi:MAG: tetratricopeptide repeat protein [Acidobacteriota bacterium]|nr:tetratricopeptide repeat protein [Acidobacteriota bacterium]
MQYRNASHSWVKAAVAGLALSATLFAQTAGSSAGAGNRGTPTVPTSPTPNTTTRQPGNIPTQNTQSPDFMQRPLYVSGKVSLDDGTAPPESVVMQLVCNASPRSVGYTDSKGRFSIDLGNRNNSAIFADASQSGAGGFDGGGIGRNTSLGQTQSGGRGSETALLGCDLQASLPGFRSDSVNLGSRRALDNPEVGTLVLHRLSNVQGLTISATSALAPKDAKKAFDKGFSEIRKSKWENAERELTKATEIYPKYAAAWYQLGVAQQAQQNIEGARKSYAQALAADSKFVSPYQQLAVIAAHDSNWKEVASETDHLLKLNPVDFPQAWFYNALANYHLQNLDIAEKSARQGLDSDSAHHIPKLDHLLGVVLAQKQDYAGAAEHMRNYLTRSPTAGDVELVKKQLAEIEKVTAAQATKKVPADSEQPKQ